MMLKNSTKYLKTDNMKKSILITCLTVLVSCTQEKPKYDYQSTIPMEIKIMQEKLSVLEQNQVSQIQNIVEITAMRNNIAIALKGHLETEVMKHETEYINLHNKLMPEEELKQFKAAIKYDSLMFIYNYDIEMFNAVKDTKQ